MKKNNTKDKSITDTTRAKNALDKTINPQAKEFAKVMYDQLAKYKQKCGCTSSGMSDLLNKSSGYFSKIESRKAFPSMETFFDFCVVCKITPKEFFDVMFETTFHVRSLEDKLNKLEPEQLRIVTELVDDMNRHNQSDTCDDSFAPDSGYDDSFL